MAANVKSTVIIFYASLLIIATTSFHECVVVEAFADPRYLKKSTRQRKSENGDRRRIALGEQAEKRNEIGERQPLVPKSASYSVPNLSATRTNVTLSFPPFSVLMDVRPGEFIASEAFTCPEPRECNAAKVNSDNNIQSSIQHQFRVKLYPLGGGGGGGKDEPSSPLSEKLPSIFQTRTEEVVYLNLEYLGLGDGKDATDPSRKANVTFALRLKGQQRERRFDVEGRAGMRFVSDKKDSKLDQGDANDFGLPLMQTNLLREFMGIIDDDDQLNDQTPLLVEAEVLIHNTVLEESLVQSSFRKSETIKPSVSRNANNNDSSRILLNEDIRLRRDGKYGHDTERVRVGKIVVPVLSRLRQRPQMFERGTYPGVEYRVLRILKDGQERFTSCPGAQYELKPIYPLVAQLERQWPVRVNEEDIPRLYTPSMYNILSVFGSVLTAATGLFTAFLLSQAISLFFIPSRSMEPTLKVGDVLLVEKLSSRTFFGRSSRSKVGDIVLFYPPSELQQIVARSGGKLNSRDLFVKRVAASAGDTVTTYKDGIVEVNNENVVDGQRDLCEAEPLRLIENYIETKKDTVINPKEVFVMGDCSSVSVDSRVWGSLKTENIVGRPVVRIWPLDRFGKVE